MARISVNLPADALEELSLLAEQEDVSIPALARQLILEGLDDAEQDD